MSAVLEVSPRVRESRPVTADDLLEMEDGNRFELVNGELVERNMD